MNFLGHCYLCFENEHLIPGNLGGDFFKGNLDNQIEYPLSVINGVKLHRFIDSFTDHSVHVKNAAEILKSNGIKRVSFIACDMLIDHYLAKYWLQYNSVSLNDYIEKIYFNTDQQLKNMPVDFYFFYEKLKEYNWISDYPFEKGIEKVMNQYSHRIGFENNLPQAFTIYLEQKERMDNLFQAFLNEIIPASKSFIIEHKLNIH